MGSEMSFPELADSVYNGGKKSDANKEVTSKGRDVYP